jgi:hypothetical protein
MDYIHIIKEMGVSTAKVSWDKEYGISVYNAFPDRDILRSTD